MITGFSYSLLWLVSFFFVFFGISSDSKLTKLNWAIPILGFVRFVILSQIISVTTQIHLLPSTIISTVILSAISIWRLRNSSKIIFSELLMYVLTLGGASTVLTLILAKSKSPFGTYNFDFVYGVQDGLYLSDHSVLIPPAQGGGFPFDWGSVGIGRYCAVFLVTLLNFITKSPLVAGQISYIISIALIFMSLIYFALNILKLPKFVSILISMAIMVNPLNLMGFHNQLLGQTSGLPVTIVILGWFMNKNDWPELSNRKNQLDLAFLVAGLFWIYPAQLLLLAPLFMIYFVFILVDRYKSGEVKYLLQGFTLVIAVLVLSVSRDFLGTINRIKALVFYSSESESAEKGSVLYNSIFNQFSSYRGPTITSGFRVYGDTNNFWPLILFYTIIFSVIVFWLFTQAIRKNRSYLSNNETMQITFILYVSFVYVILYFSQSNYLLFKLSTWFTPLATLIILVFLIRKISSGATSFLWKKLLFFLLLPGILMSAWTTYVLSSRAMDGSDIPFINSKIAFDEELRNRIASRTKNVFISMPSMEEAAWIAINVPKKNVRERINFFGFDQQSLYLGFNRRTPDFPVSEAEDSVFVPNASPDVFPSNVLEGVPVWQNSNMTETKVRSINKLFTFGVGAFYPDRAGVSPFGENQPFRWSNGYFSFGVYSNKLDRIDLTFPVLTGIDFVPPLAPTVNNGYVKQMPKTKGIYQFTWNDIELKKGWNTLVFEINSNEIKAVPKNSLRPDFRPLTIAVGKMILS